MPWDSLADMPWLGHIEPAGAPLLRGAEAGAAIASSWQRGRQVRLEQQQQTQRASEFQQLMPLRTAQAEYEKTQTQIGQVHLANQLKIQQDNLAADQIAPELRRKVSAAIAAGQTYGLNDPVFLRRESEVNSMIDSHGDLISTPSISGILGMLDKYKLGRMNMDQKLQEQQNKYDEELARTQTIRSSIENVAAANRQSRFDISTTVEGIRSKTKEDVAKLEKGGFISRLNFQNRHYNTMFHDLLKNQEFSDKQLTPEEVADQARKLLDAQYFNMVGEGVIPSEPHTPTSLVATPTQSPSSVVPSQYIKDKVYTHPSLGKLKYLGGDPNKQESWEKQ